MLAAADGWQAALANTKNSLDRNELRRNLAFEKRYEPDGCITGENILQ